AEHPVATLDQILSDRQTDLAHTDNTDRLHTPSRRTDCRRPFSTSLLELPPVPQMFRQFRV
ncbi:MAG: hypothetical protein WBL48_12915, partial [Pseudolabrys sp.]